jgi:hypothetical protein
MEIAVEAWGWRLLWSMRGTAGSEGWWGGARACGLHDHVHGVLPKGESGVFKSTHTTSIPCNVARQLVEIYGKVIFGCWKSVAAVLILLKSSPDFSCPVGINVATSDSHDLALQD